MESYAFMSNTLEPRLSFVIGSEIFNAEAYGWVQLIGTIITWFLSGSLLVQCCVFTSLYFLTSLHPHLLRIFRRFLLHQSGGWRLKIYQNSGCVSSRFLLSSLHVPDISVGMPRRWSGAVNGCDCRCLAKLGSCMGKPSNFLWHFRISFPYRATHWDRRVFHSTDPSTYWPCH